MRFFPLFSRKNRKGVPLYAVLFQGAVSLALLLTSTFDQVLTYLGFTLNLFTVLAVFGVFIHRRRFPRASRPYRTWGYPWVPLVFLAFMGWCEVYLLVLRPVQALAGLGTVLIGLPVYAATAAWNRKHPA
jgi:APA family basic amino acid/polyamine antiporter